jgi:hypothetical protein
MQNYTRGRLLGKGSYGSAFLCNNHADGRSYVIKEIDISRMPKAERESAEQEAKVKAYACLDTRRSAPGGAPGRAARRARQPDSRSAARSNLTAAHGAQAPQHRQQQGVLHAPEQALHRHGLLFGGWASACLPRRERWEGCSIRQ